jgi:L-iditol 2-dehydrogenase
MKAVLLTGVRRLEVAEVPMPVIENDTDVLLKIRKVGICGSDVHYFETGRIGSQVVEYPFALGHECTATVEAVGNSVRNIKAGERIVVEPAAPCHKCDQCKKGRENTCRNLRFLGTPGQGGGCLCEYIVMPEECCFAGGRLNLEQGVLCEPFAIGVYAVKQGKMPRNARIAILGAGPVGLSCMASASAKNVKAIYVTDKLDYRVEIARKAGAAWAGNPLKQDIADAILKQEPLGVDAVYECAGEQSTLDEAVELLKPGGRLVIIGAPRFERVSFIIDRIRRKEITIVNIRRQNGCTQEAIDLMASGKVNLDFMITHRFKPEQAQKAFEMVGEYGDSVVKALIEFEVL